MECKFAIFSDYCMAGIISSLTTCNYIGLLSQKINQLALSFISPLGTKDHGNFLIIMRVAIHFFWIFRKETHLRIL